MCEPGYCMRACESSQWVMSCWNDSSIQIVQVQFVATFWTWNKATFEFGCSRPQSVALGCELVHFFIHVSKLDRFDRSIDDRRWSHAWRRLCLIITLSKLLLGHVLKRVILDLRRITDKIDSNEIWPQAKSLCYIPHLLVSIWKAIDSTKTFCGNPNKLQYWQTLQKTSRSLYGCATMVAYTHWNKDDFAFTADIHTYWHKQWGQCKCCDRREAGACLHDCDVNVSSRVRRVVNVCLEVILILSVHHCSKKYGSNEDVVDEISKMQRTPADSSFVR